MSKLNTDALDLLGTIYGQAEETTPEVAVIKALLGHVNSTTRRIIPDTAEGRAELATLPNETIIRELDEYGSPGTLITSGKEPVVRWCLSGGVQGVASVRLPALIIDTPENRP